MSTKTVNGVDGSHLKSFMERIEKLEEDKKALADDVKEVFAEAKAFGYDPKIMREILRIRKLNQEELYEKESMVEIYRTALGMDGETEEASEANLTGETTIEAA